MKQPRLLLFLCLAVLACEEKSKVPLTPENPASSPVGLESVRVEELVQGSGKEGKKGMQLAVQYRAYLNKPGMPEIDSSYKRAAPYRFVLGEGKVIPGWEQGLVGMRVGGLRKIFVPASLAYGEKGIPQLVPSNMPMVFEIRLVEVHL